MAPEKYLAMNWVELIAHCEKLEAANDALTRTLANEGAKVIRLVSALRDLMYFAQPHFSDETQAAVMTNARMALGSSAETPAECPHGAPSRNECMSCLTLVSQQIL
jgi:hypothetical protein